MLIPAFYFNNFLKNIYFTKIIQILLIDLHFYRKLMFYSEYGLFLTGIYSYFVMLLYLYDKILFSVKD